MRNQSELAGSMNPDDKEEWSHVCETINMLYLAVCQIEATLADSNSSVDTLTKSFTTLANHTQEVSSQIQSLDKVEQLDAFKKDLADTANEMTANISSSVQAFQFYDRVCQRIDHVARSLEKVTQILEHPEAIHSQNSWKNIQSQIKSSYTMEAERIMFEFIMRGGSVKEALEIYSHHFTLDDSKPDSDEVELF